MEEIKVVGNVIFVIDEVYILIGVGVVEGVIDVVNIFKLVFVCGELQCIGVIILDEYCKYIEWDVVLECCFQLVNVGELFIDDIIEIFCGLCECYE